MIGAIQPPQSKQQQPIEQSPEKTSAGFGLSKIKIAVLAAVFGLTLAVFGFLGWNLFIKQKQAVFPEAPPTVFKAKDFNNVFSVPDQVRDRQAILPVQKKFAPDKTEAFSARQEQIYPLNIKNSIYSLSISARIVLNVQPGDNYARIVLIDKDKKEYLVYASDFLDSHETYFMVTDFCDETCYLPGILAQYLRVEFLNAAIEIKEVKFDNQMPTEEITQETEVQKQNQLLERVKRINERNEQLNLGWTAGPTKVCQLSYEEKNRMFLGDNLPNLYGFECYTGGIFRLPPEAEKTRIKQIESIKEPDQPGNQSGDPQVKGATVLAQSSLPERWDWRSAHGADNPTSPYFNDSNGWLTSIKDQGIANTCWAFAAIGALEAQIKLYYNLPTLNVDLSEQMIVDCVNNGELQAPGSAWGVPQECLNTLAIACEGRNYCKTQYTGAIDEACLKYGEGPGFNGGIDCTPFLCSNWQQRTWKNESGFHDYVFDTYSVQCSSALQTTNLTTEDLKAALIGKGPLQSGLDFMSHAMVLVGYEPDTVIPGGTVWIFKNSWGMGFQEYIKVAAEVGGIGVIPSSAPLGHFAPPADVSFWPAGFVNAIQCKDEDGDGYCFWGISDAQPLSCAALHCQPQKDCNDIDPNIHDICIASVSGNVWECGSCQDCQTKINNNAQPGDTIKLQNNIVFSDADASLRFTCISLDVGQLTLDCDNHTITQSIDPVLGPGWAVHAPSGKSTIKNCIIDNFDNGIVVDYGDSNILESNIVQNGVDGIWLSSSSQLNPNVSVQLTNNRSCGNAYSDITVAPQHMTFVTYAGSTNNTCDQATNYHDDSKSGCTNSCSGPPPVNNPPVIIQPLSADPKTVDSAGKSDLTIKANDADAGDKLSYTWQEILHSLDISACDQSNIVPNTEVKCTVTFPAVAADTNYRFKVKVSDGKDTVTSGEEQVTVKVPIIETDCDNDIDDDKDGYTDCEDYDCSANPICDGKRPPKITAISAVPNTVFTPGSSTLNVTANDPDGDELFYTWKQTTTVCSCNFVCADTNQSACQVNFGPVAANKVCKFHVTVSDKHAAQPYQRTSGELVVTLSNTPPKINSITANPQDVLSNGTSKLTVQATDTEDDLAGKSLKYAWTKATPTCPITTPDLTYCNDFSVCDIVFDSVSKEIKCVFDIEVIDSGGKTDSGGTTVTVRPAPEICDNSTDDDGDGLIDCDDPDCLSKLACNKPPQIISLTAKRTDLNNKSVPLVDANDEYLDDQKSRIGDKITLKAYATDPNDNISADSYSWEVIPPFGGILTPLGQEISFDINEIGNYQIILTVTDSLEESDSRQIQLTAIANQPPKFTNWQSISLIRKIPPDYDSNSQYSVKLNDYDLVTNTLSTTDNIPTVYNPPLAYNFVKDSDKLYISNVEVEDPESDDLTYSWYSDSGMIPGQTNKTLNFDMAPAFPNPIHLRLEAEDSYGGKADGFIILPILDFHSYKLDIVSVNNVETGTQIRLTPALNDPLLEPVSKILKKWEYLLDQWNADGRNDGISALPPESIKFIPGPASLIVDITPPIKYPSGEPIADYILPIKLTVTDPYKQTDSQEVLLNVIVTPQTGNQPPVAVIQKTLPAETIDPGNPNFTVWGGTSITLDGINSFDTDDPAQVLTYKWSELTGQISAIPKTYEITLTAPNKSTTLTIQLVVNDGEKDSAPVMLNIAIYIKKAAPGGTILFELENGDNYVVFPYEPADSSLTIEKIVDASGGFITQIDNLSNTISQKIRAGWVYKITTAGDYNLSYDYLSATTSDSSAYLTPGNFPAGSTNIVWIPEESKTLSDLQTKLGSNISAEKYNISSISSDLSLTNLDTFAFQDADFDEPTQWRLVEEGAGWTDDQICALIPSDAKDNAGDELEVYIKDSAGQFSAWQNFDILEEEKPKEVFVEIIPPNGFSNICLNAQIKLKFNQLMDESTLRYATGDVNQDTISVTAEGITCGGPGAPISFNNFNKPWHQKLFNFLARLFGRARAQITACDFQKIITEITENNTKKTVVLLKPIDATSGTVVLLAPGADYEITVTGGQDGVRGLPNQYGFFGIMTTGNVKSTFRTGIEDKICLLDHIEVTPNPKYFYIKSDSQDFLATAYDNIGTAIGEVVGQYEWEFDWTKFESKQGLITLEETPDDTIAHVANLTDQEGSATVKATATIKIVNKTLINDTIGRQVVGSANIYVIMCKEGGQYLWTYQDDGNKSNFLLAYCRTGENGEYLNNPLPFLKKDPSALLTEQSYRSELLTEYFLLYDPDQIGSYTKSAQDKFLLRVFSSDEYFISAQDKTSLQKWYEDNEEAFCEETEEKKCDEFAKLTMREDVDDYLAGQAGTNKVYAQALNVDLDQSIIYSNVYVLAMNENADQSEAQGATRSIFNQLIKNWRFNVNIGNVDQIAQLKRDYRRIQDLSLISLKLDDYYSKGGYYPTLVSNAGIAASIWDWEWRVIYNDESISLSKALNMNLPLDPNENGEFPLNIKSTENSGILKQIADILPDCSGTVCQFPTGLTSWADVYNALWGAALSLPLRCIDTAQNLFELGLGYGKTPDQLKEKDSYEIFRCYDDEYAGEYYCRDNKPSIYQYQAITDGSGSVFTLYARLEYNDDKNGAEAWCRGRSEEDCGTWTGEAGFCVWDGVDGCKVKTVVQPKCAYTIATPRVSDGIEPFNIIFDPN